MKEYIIENIQICCDAFQELLLEDRYLSHKDLEEFLDKYNDTLLLINKGYLDKDDLLYKKIYSIVNDSYNVVVKRNNAFIKRKMKELSSYFDDIFINIDNNIRLSNEQRKVIISDEDYSLISASPGTGKTTLAIAKIKYLIEKRNIDPESIVYICLSRKKCREIKDILSEIFDVDIKVLTIEEYALELMDKTYSEKYGISNYDNMVKIIYGYIKNVIFPNKEKLELLCSCFSSKIRFKSDYLNYRTFNDYYKNYIDEQYNIYKNNLDKYILNKINSIQKKYKSIKGEILRCREEVEIANYLYINGIDYEYYVKENINDYVPDFIINSNGKNIYIEFYGLTGIKEDGTYYLQDTNLKRNLKVKQSTLRKKYKDNLIELYNNIDYIVLLSDELENRGIKKHPLSKKKIFYSLMDGDKELEFQELVNYLSKFIKCFKEDKKGIDDIDDLIRNQFNSNTKKQLVLIRDVLEHYESYLENNNMIDSIDVVDKLTNSIDKLSHDSKYDIRYLILDDYQYYDKSVSIFSKKLSDTFDTKIIALGDDYESLYAFNINDLDMFKDFYNIMGYDNVIHIGSLYRRGQDVINVGTNYIGSNLNDLSLSLVSSSNLDKPVELDYYSKDDIYDKYLVLDYIINKIYRDNKKSKILIISPFKDDFNEYVDGGYFKRGHEGLLIYNNNPKVDIEYHTVYETIGMEYDDVILLADTRSFILDNDDELLKLVDNNDDLIDNKTDRRLFYIALTRSKNKLYILCPRIK